MSETKRDNKALYQLRQEIEDCLTLEADEEFDLDELDMSQPIPAGEGLKSSVSKTRAVQCQQQYGYGSNAMSEAS